MVTKRNRYHKLCIPAELDEARGSSGVPGDLDGPTVDAAERQNAWLVARSQGAGERYKRETFPVLAVRYLSTTRPFCQGRDAADYEWPQVFGSSWTTMVLTTNRNMRILAGSLAVFGPPLPCERWIASWKVQGRAFRYGIYLCCALARASGPAAGRTPNIASCNTVG